MALTMLAAAATPQPSGFGSTQALTTLLTTESLLFAAFNAGFGLTAPSAAGRRIRQACNLADAGVS
jgi:hypothetical protein